MAAVTMHHFSGLGAPFVRSKGTVSGGVFIVLGRKNWLFCDSVKGAESSAIVYSLVETAKANGVEP
ncbi:hypothetical protein H6B51_17570, partial [Pseudoflavonifractor phocaeensis]|nr:hypothetical protein [Pseudoflavonifractor phocaeensis]